MHEAHPHDRAGAAPTGAGHAHDPQGGRGPDGADRGGRPAPRGYRAVPGTVIRVLRLIRGGHFAPNPYVRNGWDQRIALDPHERAISGDLGDDHPGGDANAEADRSAAPNLPGVRDGGSVGTLLDLQAHRDGGADPAAEARADHAAVPANPGAGSVVPIRPRYAPTGGYVNVQEWRERWDDR